MQLKEQDYKLQEMEPTLHRLEKQQRKLECKQLEEQQKLDYLRINQRKQQRK